MVDKLSGFMKKRRNARLYQQWVKMNGLPVEEVPHEEPVDKNQGLEYDTDEDFQVASRRINFDSRMVTLPTRYVLSGLGIIALLLIILAVLVTILIAQSC